MKQIKKVFFILLILSISQYFSAVVYSKDVKIVNKGVSEYEIAIYKPSNKITSSFSPIKPSRLSPFKNYNDQGYEYYAARELQHYIYAISGVQLKIREVEKVKELKRNEAYIAIGKLAQDLGVLPPKSKFGIDGHSISIKSNRVLLSGETPLASYYATVLLLEQIGCRWYMPGDLGEFIPQKETITVKSQTTSVVPDLWSRMQWYSGDTIYGATREESERLAIWQLRNRQFGVRVHMGHAWNGILSPKVFFEEHPEWFALINGKRNPVQLCTTNKEMKFQFIKNLKEQIKKDPETTWWSLSPNDGSTFCECVHCKALDSGLNDITMPNKPQITDRLVVFYNEVIDSIVAEYPDKYFAFYAYVNHLAPPVREKLHPHLVPVITPITYSRYHEMNSKNSETQRALAAYVEEWARKVDFILYYTYSYNLGAQIVSYSKEHQIKHDWRFMFKNKLAGVTIETNKSWSSMLPWYYFMAKLNVDMNTDLESVEDDFYKNFFGEAGPYMRQYLQLLSNAYANMKYELDNLWFVHLLFTPNFMNEAQTYLKKAYEATNDQMKEKRIKMFDDALKTASFVVDMRERTNRCDFAGANEIIDKIKESGEEAYKSNPDASSRAHFNTHLLTYWKRPIEFSANKVKGADIIHIFPDEWPAFLDYSEIGEIGKIYLPEFPLEKWTKLKTYSKTIGEQGLNRFRGHIWYRQTFKIDKTQRDKKIHLLLSGVDSAVNVYLNGKLIGNGLGLNFGALDFDITDFINFEKDNVLVLDINNLKVVAMETGGLIRPALIYTPSQK